MSSPTIRPPQPIGPALAPTVELWAAGDDEQDRFAICGDEGYVVCYNTISADGGDHPAWRMGSAQTIAAVKAILLAGRIRCELRADTIQLRLHVTDRKVDRPLLAVVAAKTRVCLDLETDVDNPAEDWCRAYGYRDWRETALATLVG